MFSWRPSSEIFVRENFFYIGTSGGSLMNINAFSISLRKASYFFNIIAFNLLSNNSK
ncbi:hypothetical protein FFONT_0172 [Fervidicoccus fontis Kam940]|uniref:Uncharacterized protein n=1 Tax=Fervidicoccus fontis (strain DSM 19380 / JCM 18336 / VKM B-2539 / Kam940) TaxID=1163730 RepID=H9ZZK7_FERFK|nr:hypothetical protein FFONT_0172 [Fervidicoccus fontis Kam940]